MQTEFLATPYRLGIDLTASYSTNLRAWDEALRCQSVVRQARAGEGFLAVYFLERYDPTSELQWDAQLQREGRSWKITIYLCQARVCWCCISSHPMLSSPSQPSRTCSRDCSLCLSQSFLMYPHRSVQKTWFQNIPLLYTYIYMYITCIYTYMYIRHIYVYMYICLIYKIVPKRHRKCRRDILLH